LKKVIDETKRVVILSKFHSNFKPESELGESRDKALARLFSLERKFRTNSKLKLDYTKFINEYENLGHMKKVLFSTSCSDKRRERNHKIKRSA
jgi:hypothetical protein